jgi:pimeloyl-ACP methyl ester carboxylesterase
MTTLASANEPVATRIRFAGLTGREHGDRASAGPCFVFLHGLTFDRLMWYPVLDALPEGVRAIAFDLPGHGGSAPLARPGLAPVVEAVHEAVLDAGLDRPIMVGHSIGGPLATIYATAHPASGVVSIDAPLRLEPLAERLVSVAPLLRGPRFEETWETFRRSWHAELLTPRQRELLRAADNGTRAQVLSYQADILERPLDEVVRWRDEGLRSLARGGVPYLALASSGPVAPDERLLLTERLPQAEVVTWPLGHHFPHVAEPDRFVGLLRAFAGAR